MVWIYWVMVVIGTAGLVWYFTVTWMEKRQSRPPDPDPTDKAVMSENRCVFCQNVIPEGRIVCPDCERRIMAEAHERGRYRD